MPLKRREFLALLLAPAAASAQGDSPEDARGLLGAVAAFYRHLDSFEWTAIETISSDSGEIQPNTIRLTGAFRRPHFMRLELNGEHPPDNTLSVTNGKEAWLYYRSSNSYCRPDPGSTLKRPLHQAATSLTGSLPYERILEGLRSAQFLSQRTLTVGGEEVNCLVVRAIYAPEKSGYGEYVYTAPITYWIDASNKLVVQQSYGVILKRPPGYPSRTDTFTVSLAGYRIDPEIPDNRFHFRPPAGSREWPCSIGRGGG